MTISSSSKRKLPLSLSLGLNAILEQGQFLDDDFLVNLSLEEQKMLLFTQKNIVFICGNSQTKSRQLNYNLISITVRRTLALKNHTKLPVLIVVKSKNEGAQILIELTKFASSCRLYNMIYGLKDVISDHFLSTSLVNADFILLTYNKLQELVMNKAHPSTEQIVFVNPLTRGLCQSEIIKLDNIICGLHRHKCRKPYFSYIVDEALFPLVTQEEYKYLLNTENCLFFHCKEHKRIYSDNQFIETLPYLTDEHIQFSILRELFRGRKSQAELIRCFQTTITYKLYLFSNNIYPQFLANNNSPFYEKTTKLKTYIDKKVYAKITHHLTQFTKGVSKTIIGKPVADISFTSDEISSTLEFTWQDTVESTPFLPLVEKKKDSKYYLSSLGEAILASTANYAGVEIAFSSLLEELSNNLYSKSKASKKFTIKEIIKFYSLLVGYDDINLSVLPENFQSNSSESQASDILESFDQYIVKEFSTILGSYGSFASIQLLSAFEELMDPKAYLFFQRLKDYKKDKKRSWEEKRREAILEFANYEPITVKEVGVKYHLDYQQAKKELEGFVVKGLLTSIKTIDNSGRIKLRYCTNESLAKYPHLKKTCGSCKCYQKRFKTCSLLRLLQAYNPSSMPSDYREYANGTIREEATACELYEDISKFETNQEKTRFTISLEELSRKMRKIPMSYVTGKKKTNTFHCLTCQEKIEEFGTEDLVFFPRKRISCSNCATVYYRQEKKKIIVQTKHRHLLRMIYYKIAGSIPQVLLEKDPSYAFVIYDNEFVDLVIDENEEGCSPVLVICNQKIPLEKVQYLFFAGRRYKKLEKFLITLAKLEPEKYNYAINRAITKTANEESSSNKHQEKNYTTNRQYELFKTIIARASKKEILNYSFLRARHLSNICAILYLRKKNKPDKLPSWQFNQQLFDMVDLLIRVAGGVKSSYYGMQLEAQSNKYFFELLKEEGAKVDLWTRGRVNSRLVKDIFLSYNRNFSYAFSPLDTLLNQLLRVFRSEIDEIFRQMGLEPAKFGPGLFHQRLTKSDIDQLGLYFDLIEPVRVLVLVTMYEAMENGTFSSDDCSLVLGRNEQEIYRINSSSQDKFKQLASDALNKNVYYLGKIVPFLLAFEDYLLTFKQTMVNCIEQIKKEKRLSIKTIIQCFQKTNFKPFIFCPSGIEQDLALVSKFASNYSKLYKDREEEILNNRKIRETFRLKAMQKWLTWDKIFGQNDLRISKYQKREQDRSLVIILLLFYYANQMELYFAKYSTTHIRDVLMLSQNQAQRTLTRMVSRGFLVRERIKNKYYYQLNIENKGIQELLFTLGLITSNDNKQRQELLGNVDNLLDRTSEIISSLSEIVDSQNQDYPINICWTRWKPPIIYQQVLDCLKVRIEKSEKHFKVFR